MVNFKVLRHKILILPFFSAESINLTHDNELNINNGITEADSIFFNYRGHENTPITDYKFYNGTRNISDSNLSNIHAKDAILSGDLIVKGTINGTVSAEYIYLANKNIPQIKETILSYISNLNLIYSASLYETYRICQISIDTFINTWNTNDNITIITGENNIRLTFFIADKNYFKTRLDTYYPIIYEITYNYGIWSKAYQILTTNVDDNNKNSLTLSGNLTVNGIINDSTSSAAINGYIIIHNKIFFEWGNVYINKNPEQLNSTGETTYYVERIPLEIPNKLIIGFNRTEWNKSNITSVNDYIPSAIQYYKNIGFNYSIVGWI